MRHTPYGYEMIGGKIVINEEKAAVIRRIYENYLSGMSLEASAAEAGISMSNTSVKGMILNKHYYVEDDHEPIIDRGIFLRVQAEMSRRANLLSGGKKRVYSSRYALSGLVICAHCGDIFRRIKWNNRGCKSTVWRCVSRVLKKDSGIDCPARTVHEEELQAAVLTAVNDAWYRKGCVISKLRKNIRSVLEEETEGRLAEIDTAIRHKQSELIDTVNDQAGIDEISIAIIGLREERARIMVEDAKTREIRDRIDDLSDFFDEQPDEVTEYSETLVRRLIERIIVFDEKMRVVFKSGLEIEVEK